MVKSHVSIASVREVENLARMTEQQRKTLEALWLKLKDVHAAIQSSKKRQGGAGRH